MRLKTRQSRNGILKAAARLFRRNGYAATGLNEILAASGAPKGSLYHYFPGGKDDLGASTVYMAGEMVSNTLRELAETASTPEEFVENYCDRLAHWISLSKFRDGCPISTILLEKSGTNEAIRKAGQESFSNWKSVFEEVLLRCNMDRKQAREKSTLLVSAIQGAILLSRVEQSVTPFDILKRNSKSLLKQ